MKHSEKTVKNSEKLHQAAGSSLASSVVAHCKIHHFQYKIHHFNTYKIHHTKFIISIHTRFFISV